MSSVKNDLVVETLLKVNMCMINSNERFQLSEFNVNVNNLHAMTEIHLFIPRAISVNSFLKPISRKATGDVSTKFQWLKQHI